MNDQATVDPVDLQSEKNQRVVLYNEDNCGINPSNLATPDA